MKQQRVEFCDGCGKVRNDLGAGKDRPRWIELRDYQMAHGFKPEDLLLTHTYCPDCKAYVQSATKKHDPPVGASK